MIDLVEEYFKRDLNTAEEAQLAKLLAASPEAALKLAEGMTALYRQGGQADPLWPERPLPESRWKGAGTWIKLGLLVLLNLVFISLLVFLMGRFLKVRATLPAAPDTVEIVPMKEEPSAAQSTGTLARKKNPPARPSAHSPVPSQAVSLAVPPNAQSQPALPNLPNIGRQFEQLSVIVDNPQEALATVKVYDSGHTLVRHLFTGILPSGKQTLTWDGKTDQGEPAPSGTYQLELQSGEKLIRSEIHIKAGDNP